MKPGGSENRLHQHPHFKGLDVSRVRGVYRQMIGKPSSGLNERFFDPLPSTPSGEAGAASAVAEG
jgi:hypothetical protein